VYLQKDAPDVQHAHARNVDRLEAVVAADAQLDLIDCPEPGRPLPLS